VQIIAHSARTFARPRNRNWRKPRACLICPNTASTGPYSMPKHRPAVQSSNRSPLERGTEIFNAETNSQTGSSAEQRPSVGTCAGAKSPRSGAANAKRLMKVSTQGLGGGDSRARTGDPPPSHRTRLRFRRERKFSMQRQGCKIGLFSRRRQKQRLPEAGESPHCAGQMRRHPTKFDT
jgi:hypothetical protein